jgi:four helix bundle protein
MARNMQGRKSVARDLHKLDVFGLADQLVLEVYRLTAMLPDAERFGLQSQIRRAAVSVPTNIVEGAARRTTSDWVRFLEVAQGSAAEVAYLLHLSARLGYWLESDVASCSDRYDRLIRSLQRMRTTLSQSR